MHSSRMASKGDVKTTKKSFAALAKFCKKYVPVILVAVCFAAISSVLTVIGPDYISDLTALKEELVILVLILI